MNWKFKLIDDYEWCSNKPVKSDLEFYDQNKKKLRLRILKDGKIVVFKGYSWDGCSPKISIFDLFLFGTPDGIIHYNTRKPKTYYASLIHDVLYQFLDDPRMPYSRGDMDKFFLDLMRETKFIPRFLYYIFVRLIGGVYRTVAKYYHKILYRWKKNESD